MTEIPCMIHYQKRRKGKFASSRTPARAEFFKVPAPHPARIDNYFAHGREPAASENSSANQQFFTVVACRQLSPIDPKSLR